MNQLERAEIAYVAACLDGLANCKLIRSELDREIRLYAARLDMLLEMGPVLQLDPAFTPQ